MAVGGGVKHTGVEQPPYVTHSMPALSWILLVFVCAHRWGSPVTDALTGSVLSLYCYLVNKVTAGGVITDHRQAWYALRGVFHANPWR